MRKHDLQLIALLRPHDIKNFNVIHVNHNRWTAHLEDQDVGTVGTVPNPSGMVPRTTERYRLGLDGEPLQAGGIRWSPPVRVRLNHLKRRIGATFFCVSERERDSKKPERMGERK
jgi:hypothetical protein